PAQLRDRHAARRIVFGVGAQLLRQCVVRSRALPFGHVATRVDDEPVQPGRELRLATELAQAETELRQRLLCRVTCVFWIAEEVLGQPFDSPCVADAEGLERAGVTGLRASHENGVSETR